MPLSCWALGGNLVENGAPGALRWPHGGWLDHAERQTLCRTCLPPHGRGGRELVPRDWLSLSLRVLGPDSSADTSFQGTQADLGPSDLVSLRKIILTVRHPLRRVWGFPEHITPKGVSLLIISGTSPWCGRGRLGTSGGQTPG